MKGLMVGLLVFALAGCTEGAEPVATSTTRSLPAPSVEPWTPLPCDEGNATTTARNALMVPGLVGDADTIARSIARQLGDEVTGPPAPFEDSPSLAWPTREGYVIVQMANGTTYTSPGETEGTFLQAIYQQRTVLDASRVRQVLQGLGADPATLKSTNGTNGRVWQEWGGQQIFWQPVGTAGASWRPQDGGSQLRIGPLFEFLQPAPAILTAQAIESGRQFIRCYLDSTDRTEAKGYRLNTTGIQGAAVVGETLTYLVKVHHKTPAYSPCGDWDAQWTFVDAMTGAVRHRMIGPCI